MRSAFHPLPLLLLPLLAGACSLATAPEPGAAPPPVRRELRGVWVASVANIDWPSKPGLPAEQQRAELLELLDLAVSLNLNAVVLQVRPAADALYPSPHEPWSEYLTGAQGRPPEPLYDPLRFAVDEAHRRGLELHAWFNPFRARHPTATTPEDERHVSRTHPEWVKAYARYLWMDPGVDAAQEHSIRVMLDVVRRYDVDGVHIDDYFYPYPERDSAGRVIDFPDEPSWSAYVGAGGRLARADWRRANVDRFVQRLYREIKREKPWVKFGISPFGIWRPGHPPQITTSFDQYDMLYADARKWLREGWMDYFTPQLYWPIAQTAQSYPVLLRWWVDENRRGRHLWPGNFTSRTALGDPPFWPAEEVQGQVYVTRGQPGATGNIHFSARIFRMNPDSLVEMLRAGAYREPALIPASPWLGRDPPGRPVVSLVRDTAGLTVTMEPTRGVSPTWWVIRARRGAAWSTEIVPGWRRSHPLRAGEVEEVVVSGVDRNGNEGGAQRIEAR
ncbi:MAG TPA: family 10 glycosylhydrolase [Longimicrobiaceae bacterium]|nr:family 10 glycosylhydrolase [Longimicrobiaceae bacterium]